MLEDFQRAGSLSEVAPRGRRVCNDSDKLAEKISGKNMIEKQNFLLFPLSLLFENTKRLKNNNSFSSASAARR
jgi:hypothetical protein